MAAEYNSERTEQPTARRREEWRRQGRVARSADLIAAALVLVAASVLHFFGGDVTASLAEILRQSLAAPVLLTADAGSLTERIQELAGPAARALAPMLGLVVLAAVAVNVMQVGFLLSPDRVTPDFSRLDPAQGLGRIVSWRGMAAAATGLLKLLVAAAIAAGFIVGQLPKLLSAGRLDAGGLGRQMGGWLVELGFQLAIGLVVLAVADYACQLWKYEREMRMTREEIREELRQTEGHPQTRQRRREAHRRLVAKAE